MSTITGISCSIFRKEIELLQKEGRVNISIVFLDSMMHMYPEKLHVNMEAAIASEIEKGGKVALIFGECQPHVYDYEDNPNVVRISGMNCIEILLGKDAYRKLRKEGAFFLLPEWTNRWKEIFAHELGLTDKNARSLMKDMHTKLIYLDTGIEPVPHAIIQEISEYTSLSCEIYPVSLDLFCKNIQDTIVSLT